MPQNAPWVPRHPKDELSGPKITLNCEEAGFLDRLRDYAWVNGGIPNRLDVLQSLARTFHLSRYKFKKIWPILENFFELRDDLFYYPEDEEERRGHVELISNRKIWGRLGAQKRWAKSPQGAPAYNGIPDSIPMAEATLEGSEEKVAGNSQPQPQPHGGYPPDPQAAAGTIPFDFANAPTRRTATPDIAQADYDLIRNRTMALGMGAPKRGLAARVRAKFPDADMEHVLANLVRFDGQKHAGLWDQKTRRDFEEEAQLQRSGGKSKPAVAAGSSHEFARASLERDRKARGV